MVFDYHLFPIGIFGRGSYIENCLNTEKLLFELTFQMGPNLSPLV